jgi:hypothetical protein
MRKVEQYEVLVSGQWRRRQTAVKTLSREARRTAVVERKLIGGSCPNVACLPGKNVIHSAKVAWRVKTPTGIRDNLTGRRLPGRLFSGGATGTNWVFWWEYWIFKNGHGPLQNELCTS